MIGYERKLSFARQAIPHMVYLKVVTPMMGQHSRGGNLLNKLHETVQTSGTTSVFQICN